MKKITLLIDDDVYKELVSGMSVCFMTDSMYGIRDAFMLKLIQHIENGDTEVEIKYKDKKNEKNN